MRTARSLAVVTAVALVVLFASVVAATALPDLPSEKFEPAPNCGCHSYFLEQWGVSMHAKALDDPLFQYKLAEANHATDGALDPFCNGCHAPVAIMSGEITDLASASAQSKEGVGCSFCHQVSGTGEPVANLSQTMNADGVFRAQLENAVSPYHPTGYSAFHETAEFCGACHNVNHPTNGMPLEATYTEWKNGPYAAEGTVCQDCHMTPGPGPNKPNPGTAAAGGPQRDHIYIMTFAGGNVGLGDAVLAEERLKAAATLELEVPEVVEPGSTAEVKTTIINSGAGHKIPTGLTDVRQMWLEVTAVDAEGNSEVIGEHVFGTILKDAEGNSPVELWDAVDFERDDRIPPREAVSDTFEMTMPDADNVEIQASLYYRSCSEEMAEEAGVEIPTTTMVQATQAVYGSEEAMASGQGEEDDEGGGLSLNLVIAVLAFGLVAAIIIFAVMRMRRI